MRLERRGSYGALSALLGAISITGLGACAGAGDSTTTDSDLGDVARDIARPGGEDGARAVVSTVSRRTPSARKLRELIAQQVGGLDKLKVPADDASIPLPPEDPKRPGRYKTTEAKRRVPAPKRRSRSA